MTSTPWYLDCPPRNITVNDAFFAPSYAFNASSRERSTPCGIQTIFSLGIPSPFVYSCAKGQSMMVFSAFRYKNFSRARNIQAIGFLAESTPMSISASGHKSVTSKKNLALLATDKKYAESAASGCTVTPIIASGVSELLHPARTTLHANEAMFASRRQPFTRYGKVLSHTNFTPF